MFLAITKVKSRRYSKSLREEESAKRITIENFGSTETAMATHGLITVYKRRRSHLMGETICRRAEDQKSRIARLGHKMRRSLSNSIHTAKPYRETLPRKKHRRERSTAEKDKLRKL